VVAEALASQGGYIPASDQEIFELLYGMLKGYYQGLIDGALRVNGIFLVATGWIVASATSAAYLQAHPTARRTVVALVIVAHGLYLLIAFRAFALSRSTARLLGELNYMPQRYYENYRIRPLTLAVWYFTNLLITAGIVSALLIQS
jgi:hypothetical protein